MTVSRRKFLGATASAIGGVTVLPFIARAGGHLSNEIKTAGGLVVVHPVAHQVLEPPQAAPRPVVPDRLALPGPWPTLQRGSTKKDGARRGAVSLYRFCRARN